MRTVAFCEFDEHAQRILRKHWPETQIYKDIRLLFANSITEKVDVITGGFPCQDLSTAGKKAGIEKGERSGLWGEMLRVICEIRPQFAVMENVSGLLIGERGAWMGKLLSDLASIGYDAQWHCISVADIGGGHERKRIWVVAYPNQIGWDVPEKIYNSISIQIRNCRTTRATTRLLTSIKSLQIPKILPNHRILDGLSDAVDRVERLGNTVHPKITEIIGRALMEARP